jgi:predicted small secreted protein
MKKLLALLLLLTMACSLLACGNTSTGGNSPDVPSEGGNPFKENYRNDATCAILKDNAETPMVLNDGFGFMDKGSLATQAEPAISTILDLLDDSAIRFTGGNSFDEYGILHVKNESDVATVKKAVEDYLKEKREDSLYRSYFPGEEFKLDEAEVKVYGNYVVYAMLDDANRNFLFTSVKNLLLVA